MFVAAGVAWFIAPRVAEGHAEFVWVWLLPQLVIVALFAYFAINDFDRAPLFALAFGLVALLYGALLVQFGTRLHHAVSEAKTPNALVERTFELGADYMLGLVALVLITALVGGVLLVAWLALGGQA